MSTYTGGVFTVDLLGNYTMMDDEDHNFAESQPRVRNFECC